MNSPAEIEDDRRRRPCLPSRLRCSVTAVAIVTIPTAARARQACTREGRCVDNAPGVIARRVKKVQPKTRGVTGCTRRCSMPLPFPYPLCTARLGTGRQRVSQQRRLRTGADISPEAFRAWAPGPRPCWRKLVLGHRAWVIKCSQGPCYHE